jgi:lactoylglutathione lyase
VGYGDEMNSTVLELTHNWDTDSYDQGSAYGHIAIGVDDVYATCDRVKAKGGKVIREAGPMKGGRTVIAFLEDPDGYKVELLQDEPNPG